jgi:hypothetical protein
MSSSQPDPASHGEKVLDSFGGLLYS